MMKATSPEFAYHLETLEQVVTVLRDVGWQTRDAFIPAKACRVILTTLQWYLADRLASPLPCGAPFVLCWLYAELWTLHDTVLLIPGETDIALNERLWRLTYVHYVHKLLELSTMSASSVVLLVGVSRRLDAVPPPSAGALQKAACYLHGHGSFLVYDGDHRLYQQMSYQRVEDMQTAWTDVLACARQLHDHARGPARVHAIY